MKGRRLGYSAASAKFVRLRRPLGAHMSIAGGVPLAVKRAVQVGATALQIFTRNQRRWDSPPLGQRETEEFRRELAASPVRFVCAHASYLINLASPDAVTRRKSLDALIEELLRAGRLGCHCLVLHPGTPKKEPREQGMTRIVEGLAASLECTREWDVKLALENTAGQGSSIGASMQEIGEIIERVDGDPRMAVCIDTCHAFAAGYDVTEMSHVERLGREAEQAFGLERIAVLHLNDSLKECGSRVDRHAHIGQGLLGDRAFRNLFDARWTQGIPGIIETPKDEKTLHEDIINLKRLVQLGA